MSGASLADLAAAAREGTTAIYGLTRSFAAYAAARLVAAYPDDRLFIICPDEAAARQLSDDLRLFAPGSAVAALHIPAIDTSPYTDIHVDQSALSSRMAALFRLASGGGQLPAVTIISASSLLRRVIPPDQLLALSQTFADERDVDRDEAARALVAAGYARAPVVEDPGSFAVRGEVIDVFSPLYRYPVRIELFGDTIESLRMFDPDTQRTLRRVAEVVVPPVRETVPTAGADLRAKILAAADAAHHPSRATRRILEQIDGGEQFLGIESLTPAFHRELVPLWRCAAELPSARWLLIDPDAIWAAVADELEVAEARFDSRMSDGRLAFPPEQHYVSRAELEQFLATAQPRIEARSIELAEPLAPEQLGGDAQLSALAARAEATDTGDSADRLPPDQSDGMRFIVDDNRLLRAALDRARRHSADELLKPLVAAIQRWRG
ncbi:MAG: hypothetical protein AAGC55_26225, partial [Myxococcota bacterium]